MVVHSHSNGNGAPHPAPASAQAEFPIAIVGMSCRFAGDATSPSKLWDLCVAGKDSWSPIPKERFDIKAWYHENPQKAGRVSRPIPSPHSVAPLQC
jgi:acyl transferase domain-containing protein